MAADDNLFGRERALLKKMGEMVAEEANSENPIAEDFSRLIVQYDKLLKQTERMVNMSDRMQFELNELNVRLALSEQKYRNIFECATEGIFQATPEGRLVSANPAMARLFGTTTTDLLALGGRTILEPPHWKSLIESLSGEEGCTKATYLIGVGGIGRWFEISAVGVMGADGALARVDGVIGDVTKRKELEEQLRHYATVDGLTGLANRRHFLEVFESEIKRSVRHGAHVSLIMIDLDRFKSVNDTYGHHAGDLVLQSFANVAKNTMRAENMVGRVGGEEFCVLVPNAGLDGVFTAAEHLRTAVSKIAVPVEDGHIYFTISAGVCQRSDKHPDAASMLKAADEALYRAKTTGRNKVEKAA